MFVGTDDRQEAAFAVCKHSMVRRSSDPVIVTALRERSLRHAGLYKREYEVRANGQYVDKIDGKPFSTQFSFTRFLVPEIARQNKLHGWVGFCDNDFLWLDDVSKLFNLLKGREEALACVNFNLKFSEGQKMDGMQQTNYDRKLWSSLMFFNMDHPSTETITPYAVNTMDGSFLHGFKWLENKDICHMPPWWNFIPTVSTLNPSVETPSAVHFSLGLPNVPGHEDSPYAKEWFREHEHLIATLHPRPSEWITI